ncbi:MAG: hypothetical protein H5T97_14540, partial [Firmicutes bacterium]|nr:hypothetical protein [Bacillota bacterium]
ASLTELLGDGRGAPPVVVAEGPPGDPPPVPGNERWALRVSPASLPRPLAEEILEENPRDFRIRTMGHRGETYVACHHPGLGELLNTALDERLAEVRARLERVQKDVARRRLRRSSTVADRVHKILQHHECGGLVEWAYDPEARRLDFRVREDAVVRHKMQNRLLAFRTNLDREGVRAVLESYLNSLDLREHFGTVHDCTRLPVLYPYAEYHHSEGLIAGHVVVYFLAYLLRRLAGGGKVVMPDGGGVAGRG